MILRDLESFLKGQKLLIVLGTGGVGKTTCSAALGVAAARMGLRTMVLTVDPSPRLKDALGLDLSEGFTVSVPVTQCPSTGGLYAGAICPQKVFEEYVDRYLDDTSIKERLKANRLYKELSGRLSGSQEFTALENLAQCYESEAFDLVILDTPPAQHARDFFSAPEKIGRLFNESLFQKLSRPNDEMRGGKKPALGVIRSLLKKTFGKGTQGLVRGLEILTGKAFVEELFDFFTLVKHLQRPLKARTEFISSVLRSKDTAMAVVLAADQNKTESGWHYFSELQSEGFQCAGVIINRTPPFLTDSASTQDKNLSPVEKKLLSLYKEYFIYYQNQYEDLKIFADSLSKKTRVFRVPEAAADEGGLKGIHDLAESIRSWEQEET